MPQSVTELIDLLDLEEIEIGLFRARQPDTQLQRVFGGQVLAQALMAAARTVPVSRVLHSLHAYFLLPGRTDIPIVYDVEAVRDGGSFSSRRVVARQGGKVIFYLSSSFHEMEEGFDHLDPVPEDVPPPEECPTLGEVLFKATGRPISFWEREWGALDVRYVGDSRPGGALVNARHPARARVWVRARRKVARRPSAPSSRAGVRQRSDAAGRNHGAARGFDRAQRAGRVYRPRYVVSSAVPCRRVVALRPSLTVRLERPRVGNRAVSSRTNILISNVAQEGLIRPLRKSLDRRDARVARRALRIHAAKHRSASVGAARCRLEER